MTDTITLPRAVVEQVRDALSDYGRHIFPYTSVRLEAALAALDAALAEPEQKPEPVAFTRKEWSPDCGEYVEFRTVEEMKFYDRTDWTPLYAAPPKPDATREPVAHVENGVLVRSALPKGYTGPLYAAPPEPPAKREPATHEQVFAAYSASYRRYWTQYQAGWHEAERFHGIRKEDGK